MYYTDKPINSAEEDLFHRKNFAQNLAKTITNMKQSDNAYTIGLFGKWGTGKTSLINMTEQELEEEKDIIIVRFEPWNFSDSNQLIDQFFVRMSSIFKSKKDKVIEAMGDAIDIYNKTIEIAKKIPVINGKITILEKCFSFILPFSKKGPGLEKDILQQKENVERLFKKQGSRILIIIDDIDRLSNEHIRYVFQLVTAIAKFPNVTYLLSFDKGIVVKALEEVQKGDGNEYLEKVIQMPINVPDIQEKDLNNILISQLEKVIAYHNDLTVNNTRWQKLYEPCIRPMIKTLRDVNRLCNVVQFKLVNIASEVDFADMVVLSVLELFCPCIYEWVANNKGILTGDTLTFAFSNKSQSEWLELYQEELENILDENVSGSKTNINIEYVVECISRLFPYFGQKIGKIYEVYDSNLFRRNNQVAHPQKFDRYFQLDIDSVKLKKKSVLIFVYGVTEDELRKTIIELEKEDSCEELLHEINSIREEIPEERAKILIRAILATSSELNSVVRQSILSIPTSRYAEMIAYDLFENINEFERLDFLKEIMENLNSENFFSIANLINQIELAYGRLNAGEKEHNYTKIIQLEELLLLEKIFLKNAKERLKTNKLFDMNQWWIIYNLIGHYDPEYTVKYVSDILKEDIYVLKFISKSVSVWVGSGKRYELGNEYKKYLTDEQVIKSIEACICSREFFELDDNGKECCAAIYLMITESKKEVSGEDVQKIINEWNDNYVI